MSKRQVSDAMQRVAFAAELLGDAALDPRGWGQMAWSLRSFEGELKDGLQTGALAKFPGMRPDMLELIDDVVHERASPLLEELEAQIPAGLFEVRRIKGLGAKKIKVLFEGLGVTSVAELEYACNENRLTTLKGFGAKTQETVKVAIAELRRTAGHLRLDQMCALFDEVRAQLSNPDVGPLGQLARGRETLDVLEFYVLDEDEDPSEVQAALTAVGFDDVELEDDAEVLAVSARRGHTRVRALVFAERHRLGAARVVMSSSKGYRARLIERAAARGVELDESGCDGCPDEADLYEALDLAFVPAERREDHGPLVERGDAVRLVALEDLRGSLHNHTTASDGTGTLAEMHAAASAAGLEYFGITDHSVTASYAGGLDDKALLKQRDQVRALNARGEGCVILHGVESDILRDGSLDYPDAFLDELELVVASVHGRHGQGREEMSARMMRAARHPRVHVIGHPTGRLLLGRAPTDVDMDALLDACKASGTFIELNSHPARLDLNEEHLALAKEKGVLVSIAADAHSTRALAHVEYGVRIARRAGLTPDDIVNTRDLVRVKELMEGKNGRADLSS